MSKWLADFYHDIRPNARWDAVKGVVLVTIALLSWYTSTQAMFAGIPRILIGIAVFIGLAFAFAAIAFAVQAVSRLRDRDRTHEIADPQLHENCEKTISNYESSLRALREKDEAQQGQLSNRNEQIAKLQSSLDSLKWLRDMAEDQASSIFCFVQLTRCIIGKRELQRNDPYLEFVLAVDNRSVYDVKFAELGGSISFKDRELSGALTWIERRAPIHGKVGQVIFRQGLDRQDVIHILNGSPNISFDFSRLQVGIECISRNGMQPQPAHVSHLSLTNEDLLKTYPKLAIHVRQSVFSWLIYDPPQLCGEPCIVTLFLKLTNDRQTTITIETFKLETRINLSKHIAYAESGQEVWPRRYVNAGRDDHLGIGLRNLNAATPLKLVAGESVEGALQFKFDGIRYLELDYEAVEHEQFRLFLIDVEGEYHPAFCFLSALKGLSI